MSRYRNALAEKRESVRALWGGLAATTALGVVMGVGWMTAPSRLLVHIPPDLSAGAAVSPEAPGPANVYVFGLYIWQQLNRWPVDGAKDYERKIADLASFLTPACRQDRVDDFRSRRGRRELSGRERAVWEIPGRGYSAERVRAEGGGSWVVWLELQVEESVLGEPVKTRLVSYPVRVVRYAVDPELNPWLLAVDCLADVPRAIEIEGAA